MSNQLAREGWEKIAEIKTQEWRDEYGQLEYEHMWIITNHGDVFGRPLLVDETLQSVEHHYRARGYTDNNCYFMGTAQ